MPNVSYLDPHPAGTLDESTGLRAVGHIYADDKSDCTELTDDLPAKPRSETPAAK
ncbi:hypothetical protein [Candidatus Rariloculus sp.]|uniref:hypothetical protein n=1 Tax=Candidatus Rariloculus sp. TaxID=3101265 RepID=UPI003D107EF7